MAKRDLHLPTVVVITTSTFTYCNLYYNYLFIHYISIMPLQVHYNSEALPTTVIDTVSEFHAEAPQATVSEGLAQGPYVAARAGFEPTTLRSAAIDFTQFIWLGTRQQLAKLDMVALTSAFPHFTFSSTVRDLGVTLDQELTL